MIPTQLHPHQYRGYFLWLIEVRDGRYCPYWSIINGEHHQRTCRTRTAKTFPTVELALSAGHKHIDRTLSKAPGQAASTKIPNRLLTPTKRRSK